MRLVSALTVLFAATACCGADEAPTATRVIEKAKSTFPATAIPDGVKLLTGVLESCHSINDGIGPYTVEDVKKASRGDHVRFVFPNPLKVDVRRKKVDVSEAVYADGVFWLICGNEVVRCSKYTHDKWQPFLKWYQQTLPAD